VQINSSDELQLVPGFDPEFPRKNPKLPRLHTISTAMLSICYDPFHKITTKKLCDDWLNLLDRIQPQTYTTMSGFISVRRKFLNCQETKSSHRNLANWIKKNVFISRLRVFQSIFSSLSSYIQNLVFRYYKPTVLRYHIIALKFCNIEAPYHVSRELYKTDWKKIFTVEIIIPTNFLKRPMAPTIWALRICVWLSLLLLRMG